MLEDYPYIDSGLPNVWLSGIEVRETAQGRVTMIPALEELHRMIGKKIAQANRQMTGAEVRFLRTELDLSQRALAELLAVSENTLRRWEQGKVAIPGLGQRLLAGFYIETVSETGSLRELMLKLAQTDRDLTEAEIRFDRIDGAWAERAA